MSKYNQKIIRLLAIILAPFVLLSFALKLCATKIARAIRTILKERDYNDNK